MERALFNAALGGCIAVAACSSFGTANDAPASNAVDASAPVIDAATSADGAPGPGPGPGPVVSKIPAPTSLFARAGSLFFANGTKDVFSCSGDACIPHALVDGTNVKAAVAASGSGVLAIDTTCGNALRADGIYLYASDGGVRVLGDPCPTSVTATGDFAFFTSAGLETQETQWSVQRCTSTSCEAIAGDATRPMYGTPKVIAATQTDIYVGTSNGAALRWANAPDAGAPVVVVSGQFFTDLVTDGTSLAWRDGTAVHACMIADCTNTLRTVAQDSTARHLALDASGLYWTSAGSGAADGKVLHVPASGSAVTPIATGQLEPDGIALDSGFVYWTTHGCDGCAADEGAILRRRMP